MIPHVFWKTMFCRQLMIVNALYFDLYFGGWFALKVTKLSEPSKMHGSSISFNWLMELPTPHHQFGARVCNGLTPVNGYALRTFFTRKKGIDMPHVRFSWKAAPSIIVVDKRWLSALDGLFYNKGAPHSHAHNQTLIDNDEFG